MSAFEEAVGHLLHLKRNPDDPRSIQGLWGSLTEVFDRRVGHRLGSGVAEDLAAERTVKLVDHARRGRLKLSSESQAKAYLGRTIQNAVVDAMRAADGGPVAEVDQDSIEQADLEPGLDEELGHRASVEEASSTIARVRDAARESRIERHRPSFDKDWAHSQRLAIGASIDDLLADEGVARSDTEAFVKGRNRIFSAQKRLRQDLQLARDQLVEAGQLTSEQGDIATRFITHLCRCQRPGAASVEGRKAERSARLSRSKA